MSDGDHPAFISPSLQERRDNKFLMVWGDIPYWTVVDAELRDLLGRLDGTATLSEVTNSLPGRRQRQDARKAVHLLESRGVVRYGPRPQPIPTSSARNRIENIAINITHRCNLRCRFCYNLNCLVASAEGEITLANTISVLDASRPFWSDSLSISLLGGEPLLDEYKTVGLIAYARENGLVPMVSTNGTLVTPRFAVEVVKHGAEVQVSLDGALADTSDMVRGKGSFARTLTGIRTLVQAGAHTILSLVCHRGNFSELQPFYELAVSLGVSEARFIPLKRIGGADISGLDPVPLHELVASAVALFKEHPEYKRLTGRDAFSIIASNCRHAAIRESCGTGVQTFLLDANGDIYPCLNTNVRSLRVANVGEAGFSFAEVWQRSSVLQEVRRGAAVCSEKSACRRCVVRYWCLGGCRGETLATKGDLRLNAWNCSEQKKAVVETMWALSETPDIVRIAQPVER